jgi:hypothetical protein
MSNDFQTKMVAREARAALAEHTETLAWTEVKVSPVMDREDAHFIVTDGNGRKYRVTVTPEA